MLAIDPSRKNCRVLAQVSEGTLATEIGNTTGTDHLAVALVYINTQRPFDLPHLDADAIVIATVKV